MPKPSYNRNFYKNRRQITQQSAHLVLSLLWSDWEPSSVLDLGCATGTWLAATDALGCSDYMGLDGPWVDKGMLEIPSRKFLAHDFSTKAFRPERKFDLAISIEVAEHLTTGMGAALVGSLTDASDVILFSAAVPGQGGKGHLNEQRQSYWGAQFAKHGYTAIDYFRPTLWDEANVNVIYKQNMFLYVAKSRLPLAGINSPIVDTSYEFDRVHPDLLTLRVGEPVTSRVHGVTLGLKRIWMNLFHEPV